jgi:hypothetical protein
LELLAQATILRDQLTGRVETVEEAKKIAAKGFARIAWRACGPDGEKELATSGVSVRVLLHDDGRVVERPDDADVDALLARAY